jgi:hypothetical protein
MFSFQLFSKPRLVSIGLLLAILIISLMFSSYVEGMETDAVATVNKDAPLSKNLSKNSSKDSSTSSSSLKLFDGIDLGGSKTLSVSDVTGVLKNNAGVQKLIDNAQNLPSSK